MKLFRAMLPSIIFAVVMMVGGLFAVNLMAGAADQVIGCMAEEDTTIWVCLDR